MDYKKAGMTGYVQEFFIPGPLPGMNEILAAAARRKGRWSQYGAMKISWGKSIAACIQEYRLTPMQTICVEFRWVEKNKKRDKDNIACGKKFILDALVTAGILCDDGWQQVTGFTDIFLIDAARPGVLVKLMEVK